MSDRETTSSARDVIFDDVEVDETEPTSQPNNAAQDDSDAAPSAEAHAETVVDSSSPPRDEHGRFTKKEAGEEPVSDVAPATDAVTDQPPATAEASVPVEAAAEVPAPETPQPFAVTVDKETVPIPGAALFAEGLYVPTEALPRVKDLLSRGMHYEKQRRTFDQERRAIAEERAVWEQQRSQPDDATLASRFILEELQALTENPVDGLTVPPELFQILYDRVERKTLAAKLERYESGHKQAQESFSAEDQRAAKEHNLSEWINDLAQRPEIGGVLTPEHLSALRDDLLPVMDSLFVEKNGQLYVRDDVLWNRIQREAATQKRLVEAEAKAKAEALRVAKAAQEAAKFNKGVDGGSNAPAVPSRAAVGAVTTSPKDGYDPNWKSTFLSDDD